MISEDTIYRLQCDKCENYYIDDTTSSAVFDDFSWLAQQAISNLWKPITGDYHDKWLCPHCQEENGISK